MGFPVKYTENLHKIGFAKPLFPFRIIRIHNQQFHLGMASNGFHRILHAQIPAIGGGSVDCSSAELSKLETLKT